MKKLFDVNYINEKGEEKKTFLLGEEISDIEQQLEKYEWELVDAIPANICSAEYEARTKELEELERVRGQLLMNKDIDLEARVRDFNITNTEKAREGGRVLKKTKYIIPDGKNKGELIEYQSILIREFGFDGKPIGVKWKPLSSAIAESLRNRNLLLDICTLANKYPEVEEAIAWLSKRFKKVYSIVGEGYHYETYSEEENLFPLSEEERRKNEIICRFFNMTREQANKIGFNKTPKQMVEDTSTYLFWGKIYELGDSASIEKDRFSECGKLHHQGRDIEPDPIQKINTDNDIRWVSADKKGNLTAQLKSIGNRLLRLYNAKKLIFSSLRFIFKEAEEKNIVGHYDLSEDFLRGVLAFEYPELLDMIKDCEMLHESITQSLYGEGIFVKCLNILQENYENISSEGKQIVKLAAEQHYAFDFVNFRPVYNYPKGSLEWENLQDFTEGFKKPNNFDWNLPVIKHLAGKKQMGFNRDRDLSDRIDREIEIINSLHPDWEMEIFSFIGDISDYLNSDIWVEREIEVQRKIAASQKNEKELDELDSAMLSLFEQDGVATPYTWDVAYDEGDLLF